MKATASELARETARILGHVQSGKKVEIARHGKVFAAIQSVRTGSGKKLCEGLASLSKKDRLTLKAALQDARKAVPGGWR